MIDVDEKLEGDGMDEAGRALARLTGLARHELPPEAPEGASQKAYARFRRAAAAAAETGAGRTRRRGRGLLVAGAGVAAVAVAAWFVVPGLRPAPLSVSVEGGAVVEEGGYVRASAESEPSLRFSDGTEVKLARSSRVRVAETRAEGARVLLEEGRARAHVVPRKKSRWVFDAGPCRVQVTGTRFEMRWSGADQVLDVLLYSGSVVVKGPPAAGGVPVSAGQHLTMDVRKGSVRLADLAAEPDGPSSSWPSSSSYSSSSSPFSAAGPKPDAEGPPSPVDPAAKRFPAAVPATSPSPFSGHAGAAARKAAGGAPESWAARVLGGDFRGVIDEAQRRGIDDVLGGDPAANVMALADAARYAGSPQLARRALLKARARFGGSAPARRAAFLLGRMAEDQDGDLRKALDWYGIYLRDAGDDGFRAEGLGRQMAATMHLSGVAAARPLAGDYLRRYPRGAYAEAARAILTP